MKRLIHLILLCSILLTPVLTLPVLAEEDAQPETVAIPGTVGSAIGCSDWNPACEAGFLTFDESAGIWWGEFELPAGNYEYKVALNGSWDKNYGLGGVRDGPNIPLELVEDRVVTFFYDHATHWVADSHNYVIATLIGDFQTALGCAENDSPGCFITWMQDRENNGIYTLVTSAIPAGEYSARVAIDASLDTVYGADGALDGDAIAFTVPADGTEMYFGYDAATRRLTISDEGAPRGNLDKYQAYWVDADTILWRIAEAPQNTYYLHYNHDGPLVLSVGGITNGERIPLHSGRAAQATLDKFPHLARLTALQLSADDVALAPDALKGHVAVSAWDEDGRLLDATSLQIPGALDALFFYDGPLGVTYADDTPTLRVWAPTAQNVRFHLFDDATSAARAILDMDVDPATGVWSITGEPTWDKLYYLYEVTVFAPATNRVEVNLVTDPYAFSLSLNSTRSQIVNLDVDPALQPAGWDTLAKPPLAAPEDIVIYELHIRDFSINDPSVPEEYQGTYKAFTLDDTYGMQHLKRLAEAGLTHIHLLPTFDIATINEDKSTWSGPTFEELAQFPPDSPEQQAALEPYRDRNGFNWGYDPLHYTVPEGSYSTDPQGVTRIIEFREMVQSLNQTGLRVVMDVVYNHTNASGQSTKSVLDRVVPGYYHRLNAEGQVERSTCCDNTATEHLMMRKLMVDSIVTWATAYKVDGFRFDLMGHHMLDDMLAVREALDTLTLEADGVDGRSIYVYGEGWDFGEVGGGARGVNATQLNIGGTGIGAFNDRLRDAARGGGPFSGLQEQGFVTGLYDAPNATDTRSEEQQRDRLIEYMYWIRVGLAGSLAEYEMINAIGRPARGRNIFYNTAPAGYTLDPQEAINYVSAHDNETLFDAIQLKAPADLPMAERVRMQNMGLSLVMLAQGVPFYHAGSEMLRSKSMDRNSYNSGDWFNRMDFTYQDNTWGAGLPPAGENERHWPAMQPLLADPDLKPAHGHILDALAHFEELLEIRQSSRLFRLETAEDVQARLQFLNVGPEQLPGLIVMSLSDAPGPDLDPDYDLIVVLFNATQDMQDFSVGSFRDLPLALHPRQAASNDAVVREAAFDAASGTFSVPGRTTAVFVSAVAPDEIIPPMLEAAAEPPPEPTATPTEEPTAPPPPPPTATPELPPPPPPTTPGGLLPVIGVLLAALLGGGIFFWQKRKQ